MSEENVEIVRRVYDAAARGDTAIVLALYDPDVEFDASRGRWADLGGRGVYRGHEGLRTAFREYYEAWETLEDDCEELIDAGEHVISVVTSRGRGRASGAEVETTQYGVWTIREGKIVRVAFFSSRAEALEAAGVPG
jgi:ketosteroid isomerase-like protein